MDSRTGLSSACARSKVGRAHGSHSMQCAWLGLGEKRMLVTTPVLGLSERAACGFFTVLVGAVSAFQVSIEGIVFSIRVAGFDSGDAKQGVTPFPTP